MSESDKVFSEQEVTALMKRAVELQEANQHSQKDYRPGVTQDELRAGYEDNTFWPKSVPLESYLLEALEGQKVG